MATVRGINDREHQGWIERECHRTADFTFTSVSKLVKVSYIKIGQPDPFDSSVRHTPKLHTTANSVQVQNELLQLLLVNNASTLPAILQGMRNIVNANTQANRNQGTQVAGGSDQNRSYRRDLSNIRCFTCGEMGHYASFHEKPSPPPITIHAGPVHASGALPANMVSVIEEYYLPDVEDRRFFSAPAIPKKDVQKAITGKKPRTQVNVPRLQQAVDQGLLDYKDGELTPIGDMDELEDEPLPIETPLIIPPAP